MIYICVGLCVRTCSPMRIYVWAYATVCVVRCVRTHFTNRGMCQNVDNAVVSFVGAGFACPKTQSKLFSGERTSPLRTKRQHYPRFDTPLSIDRFSFDISLLFIVCFVFTA